MNVAVFANGHIHSSAPILSSLLARIERNGDVQAAALLKQISPVAWPPINLQGRYEFNKRPEDINLEAIIHELSNTRLRSTHPHNLKYTFSGGYAKKTNFRRLF